MTRQRLFGRLSAIALAVTCATTVACARTDAGITSAVKSKFAADDTVKAYQINVDTRNSVVTLKGEVDSEAGKARAVEIARATEGVRDVVDDLTVSTSASPTTGRGADEKASDIGDKLSDAGITSAVKTKMLADTTVSGLKIDVDTKDGVVSLIGDVGSPIERRRAVEIARETEGVKSVKDQLKIVKK